MKERFCLQKAVPILSFTTPWPPCRPQHNLPRICFQCCLTTGDMENLRKPLALLGWGAPRTLVWVFHRFFLGEDAKTDVANMLGLSFGEGCSCKQGFLRSQNKAKRKGLVCSASFSHRCRPATVTQPSKSSLRAAHCTRITSPWSGEPMRNDKICFWGIENL